VQPNSLIANINENIDELNRKIIPTCTLKHSDQKENLLYLIGKFKEAVQKILTKLNQNEVDYNLINFDEFNDSLEKAYKLLLDEIVLPYEKIDLTDVNNRLNKLEDDIKKIPVVPVDLNETRNNVRDNALGMPERFDQFGGDLNVMDEKIVDLRSELERSIDDKRGELDELAGRVSIIEDETVDVIRSDIDSLKDDVSKLKYDVNGIKENADYLENSAIESVRNDITDVNNLISQIGADIIKLKNDVKKPPSLHFLLNANSDLAVQMTWKECMQTIHFFFYHIFWRSFI
jgi:hypothetical protein